MKNFLSRELKNKRFGGSAKKPKLVLPQVHNETFDKQKLTFDWTEDKSELSLIQSGLGEVKLKKQLREYNSKEAIGIFLNTELN